MPELRDTVRIKSAYLKDDIVRRELDHYDADIALTPESKSAKMKILLMRNALREIRKIAAEAKAPLLLLIQPSAYDLTTNFPSSYKEMPRDFSEYDPARLTDALEEIAQSEKINSINLYDIFKSSVSNNLYFTDNTHWNDNGQALAAAVVGSYIQEKKLT